MPRVLAIGYGNPLRTDDGVGFHAAELLADSFVSNSNVQVLACADLFPELAETIAEASHVIFIDACTHGEPGKVACHPVTASQGAAAFTHHCEPASLLAAGEALYGSHPQAWLVTVCGAAFDLGERLTPRVAAALPLAVERVRRLITDCLGGGGLNAPSAPDQVERVPQVLP